MQSCGSGESTLSEVTNRGVLKEIKLSEVANRGFWDIYLP